MSDPTRQLQFRSLLRFPPLRDGFDLILKTIENTERHRLRPVLLYVTFRSVINAAPLKRRTYGF